MGIVTGKGDKGYTSLYDGSRVEKSHPRVEACGALDELCSFLGLARALVKSGRVKKVLESVQRDLFVIGAEAATHSKYLKKLKKRIGPSYVKRLDGLIKHFEREKRFEERCFCLPGENLIAASLDVARTVARRAERNIVRLKAMGILKNRYIIIYLNRLSDLLHLIARNLEAKSRKL